MREKDDEFHLLQKKEKEKKERKRYRQIHIIDICLKNLPEGRIV
jgi:cytidylate kinase